MCTRSPPAPIKLSENCFRSINFNLLRINNCRLLWGVLCVGECRAYITAVRASSTFGRGKPVQKAGGAEFLFMWRQYYFVGNVLRINPRETTNHFFGGRVRCGFRSRSFSAFCRLSKSFTDTASMCKCATIVQCAANNLNPSDVDENAHSIERRLSRCSCCCCFCLSLEYFAPCS